MVESEFDMDKLLVIHNYELCKIMAADTHLVPRTGTIPTNKGLSKHHATSIESSFMLNSVCEKLNGRHSIILLSVSTTHNQKGYVLTCWAAAFDNMSRAFDIQQPVSAASLC